MGIKANEFFASLLAEYENGVECEALDEMKPCFCGESKIDVICDKVGDKWACWIACANIICDELAVMRIADKKETALKKAIKAWNERKKE